MPEPTSWSPQCSRGWPCACARRHGAGGSRWHLPQNEKTESEESVKIVVSREITTEKKKGKPQPDVHESPNTKKKKKKKRGKCRAYGCPSIRHDRVAVSSAPTAAARQPQPQSEPGCLQPFRNGATASDGRNTVAAVSVSKESQARPPTWQREASRAGGAPTDPRCLGDRDGEALRCAGQASYTPQNEKIPRDEARRTVPLHRQDC